MNQYDQWNRRIRTIWYCSSLYVEYKNALRKSKKMPVEKKTEYWEKKHEEFATKMLNNIYELKGWWVKVGQFLSTQENIMPVAYIEKFTKLQDMMPTSSFDKIEAILKKELGNIYDLFEYIDEEPLASASIGQVHRAKLKKSGKDLNFIDNKDKNNYNVIIKIQHEGIDEFLSSDINTLKKVSWAFGLIDKNFYFNDFIDEWQDSASRELNYRYELYHQLLAYNSYKKSGIHIKIPKIYCAYTTTKVLVMEYIKGFKITDIDLIKKYNVNTYKLAYKIIDYFAYQIHNDGFFHGDPHPGNILVMMKEKKKKKKYKDSNIKRRIHSNILSYNMPNLSMDNFIEPDNMNSKIKGPNKLMDSLSKSFSFVDYSFNDNIDFDYRKKKYGSYMSENMSDDLNVIRRIASKSEEQISYRKSRTKCSKEIKRKLDKRCNKSNDNSNMNASPRNISSVNNKSYIKRKAEKKKEDKYSFLPVIIDWGLIKQLDSVMKVAFCKLIYNISCMNVLNIIEAFEDMGFCFKEDFTYDPEIYIENLKRFFLKKLEESSSKLNDGQKESTNSNEEISKNSNMEMLKNIEKKDVLDKNPISDVPKDIIFFIRVASLLHGLCTQLDVKINYISIFSRRAKEALEKIYKPIDKSIYTIPIDKTPNSFLEKRIHNFLKKLYEKNKILGCQLCIIHKKKLVVNTCVGVTSTTDKRPITKHSLFNGYSLNKIVLTFALIHLICNSVNEHNSTENVFLSFNKNKKNDREKKKIKKGSKNGLEIIESQNNFVSEKFSDINKIEYDYFSPQKKKSIYFEDVTLGKKKNINYNRVRSSSCNNRNIDNNNNSSKKVVYNENKEKPFKSTNDSYSKNNTEYSNILNENILKDIESKQIKNFKNTINDYICNYWDGFICNNKKNIRIKDVLTLKCFIRKPFHDKITLSKFIDYEKMINMIENSKNYNVKNKSSKYGEYLYLIDSYIIAELIRNISGLKYHEYIYKYIIKPLQLTEEMFIPIPTYLLKRNEEELKRKNQLVNEKWKKTTKDKKVSSQKECTSNTSKSNELIPNSFSPRNAHNISSSIPDIFSDIDQERDYNFYCNDDIRCKLHCARSDYKNKNNKNFNEKKIAKRRNISVDVYCTMKKKKEDDTKNLKNLNNVLQNNNFLNTLPDSSKELLTSGNVEKDRDIRKYSHNDNGEVCKEVDSNDITNRKSELNILINSENFKRTSEKGFDSTSILESNLKNKNPVSFKNKFLNHVDNLKVKTRKINDSLKNIYENNENTFLKKFFPLQKKRDIKNYNDNNTTYVSYKNKNNYNNNEVIKKDGGIKEITEEKDDKWNMKNMREVTSSSRETSNNNKFLLSSHDLKVNGRMYRRTQKCANYKLINYNLNNNNNNNIINSTNLTGVVLRYQNNTNKLVDYNMDFFPHPFLNNFTENFKNEENDSRNLFYNLEEGRKYYKFFYDENIKSLFENIDTKTSGDESANSILKEKYNDSQKKNKKYKQFFKCIKELRNSLKEKEKKLKKTSFPLLKKNEEKNSNSVEEEEIKKDEVLMKNLIEYKYMILQRQYNNVMKKKTKKNIYINEYSDDIEMFSDTSSNSSDSITTFRGKKKNEKKERRKINEKKKQLEIYLVMNSLYKKNKKGLISKENHTINKKTDVYWRLAYARRDINVVDNISRTDMNKKLEMFKQNMKNKKSSSDSENEENNITNEQEKIIHDVKKLDTKLKMYLDNFNVKHYNKYISLFQLMQIKPYILDPLIYDSKKILDKYIPTNGRFTAKALCKLLAFANNQFFFPSYILNKIRKVYTLDKSIESYILTGGMSRKWGMGFQIFECEYSGEINEDFNIYKEKKKRKKKKKNENEDKNKNIHAPNNKTIVGYGQSDYSGCFAVSFPEIDLSLTILLSDIFKGPEVSHLILDYVLKVYGIKPKWKLPIEVSELIKIL